MKEKCTSWVYGVEFKSEQPKYTIGRC